jgi:hypothetical protein
MLKLGRCASLSTVLKRRMARYEINESYGKIIVSHRRGRQLLFRISALKLRWCVVRGAVGGGSTLCVYLRSKADRAWLFNHGTGRTRFRSKQSTIYLRPDSDCAAPDSTQTATCKSITCWIDKSMEGSRSPGCLTHVGRRRRGLHEEKK